MEGLQECPVCTLFMREGISLRKHLDTHPKDQVIEALLRIKNEPEQSNAVVGAGAQAQPIMPTLQPSPQLTTAFTYQQILTTNSSGAVVPQYMQIPMFVNPSFPMGQTVPFPGFVNPVVNSYGTQPYVISNATTNITADAPPAPEPSPPAQQEETIVDATAVEEQELEPEGSCEMEFSDYSPASSTPPPLTSVIISRPSSGFSSSHPETPSSPPLTPSPSVASSGGSCKAEDTVIVETPYTSHVIEDKCPNECERVYKVEQIVEETLLQEANNYDHNNQEAVEYFGDENEVETSLFETQDMKQADELYGDLNVGMEDAPPVYADLLPAQSSSEGTHRMIQGFSSDLGPGTSTAFMELDGIRIFFNGSVLSSAPRETSPSPSKSCSVIQLADSTKPDLQDTKGVVDVKENSLNILADESMPARGELSEQESLGADSAWGLFQQDVKDWVKRSFKCSSCDLSFTCPKERRVHRNAVHSKPTKVIRCTACPAVFTTLRDRRIHMAEHNTVKTEPVEVSSSTSRACPECPTVVANVRALRTHLRESHNHIRFKCESCEACFDEEPDFNEHLKVHPLKCTQCDKTFQRRANLNLHKRRHLDVKPFVCALCPKSFVTRQKLEEHSNGHAGIKPIKCTLCSKTFSRHSNLIQHRNLHHLKNRKKIRDYVCRCGEIFHSQKKLEWHKEIHDNKPKSCPFCAQKFIHAASVTRHARRSHHPDYLPAGYSRDEENVSCPICDKMYLRSSLQVHMRVHSGERPFQCNICCKKFSTKWNMELHQWTHQSRAQMPYKCTMCKSAFFRETDYVAHVNAHKNLKPFICNVCGQKFIRKYNCLRHQEEHRRAKRFSCTVRGCDKSFHRSYYLKDHMKVHTGVRPHTCHICGKASTTKSNHNKHLRIHDTREPVNTEN